MSIPVEMFLIDSSRSKPDHHNYVLPYSKDFGPRSWLSKQDPILCAILAQPAWVTITGKSLEEITICDRTKCLAYKGRVRLEVLHTDITPYISRYRCQRTTVIKVRSRTRLA